MKAANGAKLTGNSPQPQSSVIRLSALECADIIPYFFLLRSPGTLPYRTPVGNVLPRRDTKEPHGKNEVSPHLHNKLAVRSMRGTAGAAGDAGATGIDSCHPQLRSQQSAPVAVCACACVRAIQGRDQCSGSSVTSLSNVHPPLPGPLSHGQAVPGQED